MRFTRPPLRARLRRNCQHLRSALPPLFYIAVALLVVWDLSMHAVGPARGLVDFLNATWDEIPKPAWTLIGLAVVVFLLGVGLVPLYSFLESALLWRPRFGRSVVGVSLARLASQDLRLRIEATVEELHIPHYFATLVAVAQRLLETPRLFRQMSNLELARADAEYKRTIVHLIESWRAGVQGSILLDHLSRLHRIPAVNTIEDVLHGQITAANITYLLGDLHEGLRLANAAMTEAERCDIGGLPVYQWMASYAHGNVRIFLGMFDKAADMLGERWRRCYIALPDVQKQLLMPEVASRTTLNPIASVGRHILLASAFAGRPLMSTSTNPLASGTCSTTEEWAQSWLQHSLALGTSEKITLDFSRAYMALYHLFVDDHSERFKNVEEFLLQIQDDAPHPCRGTSSTVCAVSRE